MGPHPAVAEVRLAVRRALPPEPGRVLVACSGGADSLALAAALAFEAPRAGLRAGLVTVDHGLQPGSAEQAARVAALGYELGLDPVEIVPVAVDCAGGPEAAARAARYGALDAVRSALDASVLLAHTRDDQAETVLLGLARGSGPRSLAGMRPVQGRYLRPLLGLGRDTTRAACAALGLPVWDDPHNADPAFLRVRVRNEVLPVLEQVLGPGVAAALARTAELMRDDLDALDGLARQLADPLAHPVHDQGRVVALFRPELGVDQGEGGRDGPGGQRTALDVHELAGLPRALRTRVLRVWAAGHGAGALSAERTAALDALVSAWHGQGPVQLPGALQVARVSGRLEIAQSPKPDPQE